MNKRQNCIFIKRWNFEKFLIDGSGRPRFRFDPSSPPLEMEGQVEMLLQELE